MFLVVFVTLVISIIGLYAQVITLQTAKMNRAQTTLAQTMSEWHSAALRLALAHPGDVTMGNPCRLTIMPFEQNGTADPGIYPPKCSVTVGAADLPNYTFSNFYSILFQYSAAPAVNYMVTFVPPPANNDFISVPDQFGTQTGFRINDLDAQFRRLGTANLVHHLRINNLSFGAVTKVGTQLTLTVKTNSSGMLSNTVAFTDTSLAYPIPASVVIPVGSLALISPAQ